MSEPTNPWVKRAPKPDPVSPTDPGSVLALPRSLQVTGASAPQHGVPEPDSADRLPRRLVDAQAAAWWVGAHGGAGESTLAALVPGTRAAGHAWPVGTPAGELESPARVILVARTHMHGLRSAQRAAASWASGVAPVELLGLVLIADAPGRLPRPLRNFADVLRGGVPRVWHLPWIETWRMGDEPTVADAPKDVRRLVEDARALLNTRSAVPHGNNSKEV